MIYDMIMLVVITSTEDVMSHKTVKFWKSWKDLSVKYSRGIQSRKELLGNTSFEAVLIIENTFKSIVEMSSELIIRYSSVYDYSRKTNLAIQMFSYDEKR